MTYDTTFSPIFLRGLTPDACAMPQDHVLQHSYYTPTTRYRFPSVVFAHTASKDSTAAPPGYCSSAVSMVSIGSCGGLASQDKTNLPFLQFLLLLLILHKQFLQHLAQTLRVRLQRRHDILDRALNEHAVNHAEAFAVAGEGSQGFEDEPRT